MVEVVLVVAVMVALEEVMPSWRRRSKRVQ